MKFAVFAALFAAVQAADTIALPFSLDDLALLQAKKGKERFDLYMDMVIAQWKKADTAASVTRSNTYYTDIEVANDKWANDIVAAAGVTGQQLEDLWNELQEQRLKLDIQARESEKIANEVADELVKENPELKEKLASDGDMKSFTDAVQSMGTDLAAAVQKKAEAATLDKAEAGIFSLDAATQKAYDDTQKELKDAAEKKALENSEAIFKELEAAKKAGTLKDDGLSIADKIKAMKEANDLRVKDEETQAAAAKAQMAELKKLGLFETGDKKLKDEEVKALIAKQKAVQEAAANAANPIVGKDGFPCPKNVPSKDDKGVELKDEDGNAILVRSPCAENYCCGTAWTVGVDEDDTIVEGKSFHVKDNAELQRLEVCGPAQMDDPEEKDDAGAAIKIPNVKFQTTIIKENIPIILDLQFACIVGAKALAASAAAVLTASVAM